MAGASAPWLSPAHITVIIGAATLGEVVQSAVAFTTGSPAATYWAAGTPWPGRSPPPASTPRAWLILAMVLWYFLVAHPSIEWPTTWAPESSCHLDFVVPHVRPFQMALSRPAFLDFTQSTVIPYSMHLPRVANLRLQCRRPVTSPLTVGEVARSTERTITSPTVSSHVCLGSGPVGPVYGGGVRLPD